MSRPSVLRFGSQSSIKLPHTAPASSPNFTFYKTTPLTTTPRSQTLPTSTMKPSFSWKSLRNIFSNRQNEEDKKESVSEEHLPSIAPPSLLAHSPDIDMQTPCSSQSTPLSRQSTEIDYQPQTVAETAEELTSLDVVVRDYAYPSSTEPAPFANVPAPSLPRPPVAVFFLDPGFALAEIDYRISTNSPLAINGQKARWLLDMGWLTEKDQDEWRLCDWQAFKAYDNKPHNCKPRFYVQPQHRQPITHKERLANAQRWRSACANIESHELNARRTKRGRVDSLSDLGLLEIRNPKRPKVDKPSPSPPSNTRSSPPQQKKRRKAPSLPPAPLKQFPAPLENYDPAQYNIEEIKASQEAMRRRDQARIAAMEANALSRSPTPELQSDPTPSSSSPSPPTPLSSQPSQPTNPKRKLGLRRTETLMHF